MMMHVSPLSRASTRSWEPWALCPGRLGRRRGLAVSARNALHFSVQPGAELFKSQQQMDYSEAPGMEASTTEGYFTLHGSGIGETRMEVAQQQVDEFLQATAQLHMQLARDVGHCMHAMSTTKRKLAPKAVGSKGAHFLAVEQPLAYAQAQLGGWSSVQRWSFALVLVVALIVPQWLKHQLRKAAQHKDAMELNEANEASRLAQLQRYQAALIADSVKKQQQQQQEWKAEPWPLSATSTSRKAEAQSAQDMASDSKVRRQFEQFLKSSKVSTQKNPANSKDWKDGLPKANRAQLEEMTRRMRDANKGQEEDKKIVTFDDLYNQPLPSRSHTETSGETPQEETMADRAARRRARLSAQFPSEDVVATMAGMGGRGVSAARSVARPAFSPPPPLVGRASSTPSSNGATESDTSSHQSTTRSPPTSESSSRPSTPPLERLAHSATLHSFPSPPTLPSTSSYTAQHQNNAVSATAMPGTGLRTSASGATVQLKATQVSQVLAGVSERASSFLTSSLQQGSSACAQEANILVDGDEQHSHSTESSQGQGQEHQQEESRNAPQADQGVRASVPAEVLTHSSPDKHPTLGRFMRRPTVRG